MSDFAFCLAVSAALFTLGVVGVVVKRNAIVVFMCIELMLNGANLSFVTFARQHGQVDGQIFVFFVMAIAAAEVAIGLAIIVTVFRNRASINVDDVTMLRR
jgi:NADH-quinone oxidoreductase subunit K